MTKMILDYLVMISLPNLFFFFRCLDNNGLIDVFNPITNYKRWKFNWFGIAIITLMFNVVFLLFALYYWVHKLFTIGREV